jgi:hypothetical protein
MSRFFFVLLFIVPGWICAQSLKCNAREEMGAGIWSFTYDSTIFSRSGPGRRVDPMRTTQVMVLSYDLSDSLTHLIYRYDEGALGNSVDYKLTVTTGYNISDRVKVAGEQLNSYPQIEKGTASTVYSKQVVLVLSPAIQNPSDRVIGTLTVLEDSKKPTDTYCWQLNASAFPGNGQVFTNTQILGLPPGHNKRVRITIGDYSGNTAIDDPFIQIYRNGNPINEKFGQNTSVIMEGHQFSISFREPEKIFKDYQIKGSIDILDL